MKQIFIVLPHYGLINPHAIQQKIQATCGIPRNYGMRFIHPSVCEWNKYAIPDNLSAEELVRAHEPMPPTAHFLAPNGVKGLHVGENE
jgi:hypothetical protein